MKNWPTLLFPILMLVVPAFGKKDSTAAIKVLPVPAFGYAPETKTYIGAVALFTLDLYKDTNTRTSNTKIEFNYTWRKQIISEIEWEYFFKHEKWFTRGEINVSSYPDYYYGLGSYTPDSNELLYDSKRITCDVQVLKNIGNNFFTGPGVRYLDYHGLGPLTIADQYPELINRRVFGLNYTFALDERDNILTSKSGKYFYLTAGYNFSTNNYLKVTSDIRYYWSHKNKQTLAFRLLNDLNFGNPPFFDMALLGGDEIVRGYYLGRYRDKNLGTFQTEFRSSLFWRIGCAVFGGLSSVYSNQNPLSINGIKYNYGAGIRFMIDRKEGTNLRIDYARGANSSSGFYISFGEAF